MLCCVSKLLALSFLNISLFPVRGNFRVTIKHWGGFIVLKKCRGEEELVKFLPLTDGGGLWADTSQGQVPQPRELS